MARNGASFLFLLVSVGVLLMVAPASVRGDSGCEGENNNGESGKVADFFHKVGCGLKTGAKQITESVKDGYKYVKGKIQDINSEPTTPANIDLRSGNTEKPIPLAPLN